MEKFEHKYGAEQIQVLEGLEAVRKSPGMYIGSVSARGLHHLVYEIVDNSVDEALAGYCKEIKVIIEPGNIISVEDNGRGIPVEVHPKTKISTAETVYTVLHAGGIFGGDSGYIVSGGLHGVGASVVNALSSWVEVKVHKEGGIHLIRFENGGKTAIPLHKIGDCKDTGTIVTFQPDPTIFQDTVTFNYNTIRDRIRQMAFLNKGVRIIVEDHRKEMSVSEGILPGSKDEFCYKGGVKEYVQYLNKNKIAMSEEVIYCEGKEQDIVVEIALQYNDTYTANIYSFCNNIRTSDGGTHEEGFRMALTRVLNAYAKANKFLKENDDNYTQDDTLEGITAIISIKHPNPQYEGQTKGKLGNSEVRKIVSSVFSSQLDRFLQENPAIAKLIMNKINLASNARLAAKKARETVRKGSGMELTSLPGKLADCASSDPTKCELYIVEGDSAGGSAKNGRDRETQAILPLRGKILNVEKAQMKRVFENAEIGNMIIAIGGGYEKNGEHFDITKIRYHKVVIMTDADVDGSHIRILLLTFFYRYMRPLIENGFVYIAQPPLYKASRGNKDYYCYNDEQLDALKKKLGPQIASRLKIQRYKGLGEMDAEQLWETTMDPAQRKMIKVKMSDAMEADQIFDALMGERVEPRKDFIRENAKFVKNLDI